jgi:hypothetical protein
MKCQVIDLYPDPQNGGWTRKYPHYIPEPTENDETAEYAFLKRNQRSSDSRKKLSLHSIVIQSPFIKKVLGKAFEGYEGITTELERLEFESPFEPFVHRWEKFRSLKYLEEDGVTKQHLDLLWDCLEGELRLTLAKKYDLLANGVMTYSYLWTMFEPGTLVFTNVGGNERVMRIQSYDYGCNSFSVHNRFVEWTGHKFGMENHTSSIGSYDGTRKISALSVYPLIYHPDTLGIQKRCIARAKEWETFCKYSFMSYKGGATSGGSRHNIDSRVIIDTAAYNKFNPNSAISVYGLEDDTSYHAPSPDSADEKPSKLTAWQQLLATNVLRGYSLKDKIWLDLQLANVKEIIWNDKAFGSLVLPDDTKDLVLAFAESQIKRDPTFDDIIAGKGKGVIMLLSGPPGVGKTLTAEAVAETMRVPLYMMAAGDLGTDPYEVESSLQRILKMTTKWKAVLLLDEADVFLEARSTHDLERNKLVSIFLRSLEYYEGFLFLTSNRVDNIDAAFESRIHLSLMYGNLSFESRRQIWMTFLAGNTSFSTEQIDTLAQIELNGRQIKNILKTAQLLATHKNEPLQFKYVQTITKLRAANACIPLKSS